MSDAPKRMSPERLEELRTLPEVSGLPYYRMQEGRELIAEIDALQSELAGAIKALGGGVAAIADALADCKALAAECRYSRQYDNLLHTCDRDPTRPCRACEASRNLEAARTATDANGALARHGGGA